MNEFNNDKEKRIYYRVEAKVIVKNIFGCITDIKWEVLNSKYKLLDKGCFLRISWDSPMIPTSKDDCEKIIDVLNKMGKPV